LAKWGSKFEGTGFEKAQIGQIHVALLAGEVSGEGIWNGLSDRDSGEAVALREGWLDAPRFWRDVRFEGFGKRVILAEDFRKPACLKVRR
jgi:hypothetical protein